MNLKEFVLKAFPYNNSEEMLQNTSNFYLESICFFLKSLFSRQTRKQMGVTNKWDELEQNTAYMEELVYILVHHLLLYYTFFGRFDLIRKFLKENHLLNNELELLLDEFEKEAALLKQQQLILDYNEILSRLNKYAVGLIKNAKNNRAGPLTSMELYQYHQLMIIGVYQRYVERISVIYIDTTHKKIEIAEKLINALKTDHSIPQGEKEGFIDYFQQYQAQNLEFIKQFKQQPVRKTIGDYSEHAVIFYELRIKIHDNDKLFDRKFKELNQQFGNKFIKFNEQLVQINAQSKKAIHYEEEKTFKELGELSKHHEKTYHLAVEESQEKVIQLLKNYPINTLSIENQDLINQLIAQRNNHSKASYPEQIKEYLSTFTKIKPSLDSTRAPQVVSALNHEIIQLEKLAQSKTDIDAMFKSFTYSEQGEVSRDDRVYAKIDTASITPIHPPVDCSNQYKSQLVKMKKEIPEENAIQLAEVEVFWMRNLLTVLTKLHADEPDEKHSIQEAKELTKKSIEGKSSIEDLNQLTEIVSKLLTNHRELLETHCDELNECIIHHTTQEIQNGLG